jgi:triosephosphate isomerase (TIM)
MRKKIAAGNWKMNKILEEGLQLVAEIIEMSKNLTSDAQVVLNVPFIHLTEVRKLIPTGRHIFLGAQNCFYEKSGAYTGEISVDMLKSIPVEFTVIGHSERREYFQETNAQLATKTDLLLEQGITPIFCCGETLAIREAGNHIDFVKNQLTEGLFHLSPEQMAKVVIAYEPIWAIGTGVTASTEQAQEMHAELRKHFQSKYGDVIAQNLSILYGGSVKPDNAKELFACEDVDGGLVGGASLKAKDFMDIVAAF